jgi:two-component system, chemotaxis family, chemotaxis protein CheY
MSLIDQIFGTEEAGYQGNGTRVLVTDDDSVQRELMCGRLESVGFEVDEAANGYETLEKLKEFHYDALVMDTNMPGMLGYEVCSEVRKTPLGKRLAVLGMSALPNNRSYWDDVDVDVFLDKADVDLTPYVLEVKINSAVAYRKGI